MIIALLVVICIMAVDLRNLANKVKESNKYYLKCIKLMNDMDITLLDKINDLNDREEDIERLKNEGKLIEQQLETIIELKKIGNDLDKLDNVIKADKTKATAITKSCSIDSKCNYMDKFTTVK